MKKRFVLLALIPMFAVMAIIGSGFSLWFFNNASSEVLDQGVSKDVTQLVEVGAITKADNFTVIFDQTETGRENNGGNVDLGDNPSGITLKFADDAKKSATYQSSADGIDHLEDGSIYYNFVTKITVTKALADYIDIKYNGVTSEVSEDGTTVTFTQKNGTEFDWTKVSITYKDTKEPANKEAYKTFEEIVKNVANTITVSYKVEIKKA